MSWGTIFLTVHLLGVALWFGGAFYERIFVFAGVREHQGSPMELVYTKVMLKTQPFFLVSVLLLLIGGVGMTIFYRLGFLPASWLGIKQGLAIVMVAIFAGYIGPTMKKTEQQVQALGDKAATVTPEIRRNVHNFQLALDIVHVGLVINFLLGIWQPF
ncbi:MAG: hypothetical protein K0R39_3755 [Symbiobacteriaceae bacterium]|jgi:uncharacterized membrane protein|nr:hypothetical protein [Symbiobacteriaceae bacterium]